MAQTSIPNPPHTEQGHSQPNFNFEEEKYKAPLSIDFPKNSDLITDCIAHMSQNGFPIDNIRDDGQIHRFSIDSKKGQPDEWYVARAWEHNRRPLLCCCYGSWSSGEKHYYRSWENSQPTFHSDSEKKEFDRFHRKLEEQAKKAKKLSQDKAAAEAQKIWENAHSQPPSPAHSAYVQMKGIKPCGIRFGDNPSGYAAIIVPLTNAEGQLRSLQFISVGKEGKVFKQFLPGGEAGGLFHAFGNPQGSASAFVAEGYSTGCSIFEATGQPVFIAFTCGNLPAVVENIQKKYPHLDLTIAGDDDTEGINNPGRQKAKAAANKFGCKLVFPKFPPEYRLESGKKPTDFNDLHASFGIEEIKSQLIPQRGHLSPINIEEFLRLEIPPRELILSPWLPEQGLAMIFARAGIGKTYLALSIAYAIASGDSILKWNAPKPRRVLYVDGEMPASTMQARISKIANSFEKKPPPSFLQLVTPNLQDKGIRDLSTKDGQSDIDALIQYVDVIVLDNLSCLVRSGNENDAESWKPVQEWVLKLRKEGKAVIFVHHAGKSGKERGTSKKEDVLDTVIELKRPSGYSPAEGAKFEVSFTKSRSFEGEEASPFSAQAVTDEEGNFKWVYSDIDNNQYELVIELSLEGLTQREISDEVGKSLGTVNKLIRRAKDEGRL